MMLGGVKPDAAALAVTDIEGYAARAFLAQRVFAGGTFHSFSAMG